MNVDINWVAVLLATASSMVVGGVWYAKGVFGERWAKMVGLKEKDMKNGAVQAMLVTVVVSFLTAFVLAHVTFLANQFFGNSYMMDALTTAFWLWVGLTAARIITHDVFERRPLQLTLMTVAHEFVTISVMAIIIGWLKP